MWRGKLGWKERKGRSGGHGGWSPPVVSTQSCREAIFTNRLCQLRGGMWGEALLWFWRTDQCQPSSTDVGAVKEKMAVAVGVKGMQELKFKWRWLLPTLVPYQTSVPDTSEINRDVATGKRGVWFQQLGFVVGKPRSAWFQGHGLMSQEAPQLPPCWQTTPPPQTHSYCCAS